MKKYLVLLLILFLGGLSFGDIFYSHLRPISDNAIDVGTGTYRFRLLEVVDINVGDDLVVRDDLTVVGTAQAGVGTFALITGNLIPSLHNTFTLGNNLARWDAIWGNNITGTTLTDGTLSISSGSITNAVNITATTTIQGADVTATDDVTAGDSFFASNGLVGSPAYSFTSDATTGMYYNPIGNTLYLVTEGVYRLRASSTNVLLNVPLNMNDNAITDISKAEIVSSGNTNTALAVGTVDTALTWEGLVELASTSGNMLPASSEAMLSIDAYPDINNIPANYFFGIGDFVHPEGTLTQSNNYYIGIFGGVAGKLDMSSNVKANLIGLQYSVANEGDWAQSGAGTTKPITTKGFVISSRLGFAGKAISGTKGQGINSGGEISSSMDGTYNATVAGENCGLKVTTINSLDDGTGDVTNYGIYLDTCIGDTNIGSGGALTTWGFYGASDVNNVFNGGLGVGSVAAPDKTFVVTGDASMGDGTNDTQLASDGTQTMTGTARVTKYTWIPVGALRAGGAAPASNELNDNGYDILSFADNADNWAQANIKVPDDMDLSADSYLCVGWSSPTTDANCVWDMKYLITAPDDSTDAAGTSDTGNIVVSSSNAEGLVVSLVVTISGETIQSDEICIHLQIMRDGDNDSDTLEDVAEVHGVAFQYTANKLGTDI